MARNERFGRPITDTQALRALAHAGRYAILERLQMGGPATATECAEVAGLSPSACSYHLRLLARHGFVEEDRDPAGDRDRRERVWRAVVTSWQSEPDESDPAAMALDSTLARVMIANSDAKALAWVDSSTQQPREWRDAALFSNSTIVATADELATLTGRMMDLIAPYFQTNRPVEQAPEGARQIHVALRMVPRTG